MISATALPPASPLGAPAPGGPPNVAIFRHAERLLGRHLAEPPHRQARIRAADEGRGRHRLTSKLARR